MSEIPVTVHMVVKNEDRFIWYCVMSVLPYVKKIFISDTGSTDNTINIINKIDGDKIVLLHENVSSPQDISLIRQKQLDKTLTDWVWIVDGDEVYSQRLIDEIDNIIKVNGSSLEGIVVGRYDLLGDIFHYQDNSAGVYDLFGKKGHFALRLMNRKNIPGLHVEGIYPYEGYYDKKRTEIIHHPSHKFIFTHNKLFHAMYLQRSSKGTELSDTFQRTKYKIETGIQIPIKDIPEVFFQKHPADVADVTKKRQFSYEVAASIITPFKKLKRITLS